jgi:3'(2'), 5'-bisphosphate nucleotidase
VDATLLRMQQLSSRIDATRYKQLTVFVDPIDGTREFATGRGECVTVLLGYNDPAGRPAAGIVYRPLTQPATWAAGALQEGEPQTSSSSSSTRPTVQGA